MTTLVVSPHFDDAALSAWAVLEGPDVRVANVFTAVPPPGAPTYWERLTRVRGTAAERIAERVVEDRDALALAGVEPVNLGFLEAQHGGGPNLQPEASLERKLTAIATYRTQADALNSGPLRRVSNPEVVCFEVVWTPEIH